MAAAPGEAARRKGDRADAPYRDTAIVGAGDAAAVLAEVEIGHRAGMWAELAHLAALHDEGALAGRGGDGAGRAMRREMLEPLASLAGKLGRRSVAGDAQQATVVAAAHESIARRIADQRQHRAAMQGIASWCFRGVDVGRQQAHAPVAEREGCDRALLVEGAGSRRCVARNGTAWRQGLAPGRI